MPIDVCRYMEIGTRSERDDDGIGSDYDYQIRFVGLENENRPKPILSTFVCPLCGGTGEPVGSKRFTPYCSFCGGTGEHTDLTWC